MLRSIEAAALSQTLRQLAGRTVYLHMEVTPGGFLRNLAVEVEEAVLRSDGSSYRIALLCPGDGWVVMEGLTHMCIEGGGPLLFGRLEEEDRLTRVIQISEEAFTA